MNKIYSTFFFEESQKCGFVKNPIVGGLSDGWNVEGISTEG